MLSNHSFLILTNKSQSSRLRKLKNGILQGSMEPMVFNIYITCNTVKEVQLCRCYADDLAILLRKAILGGSRSGPLWRHEHSVFTTEELVPEALCWWDRINDVSPPQQRNHMCRQSNVLHHKWKCIFPVIFAFSLKKTCVCIQTPLSIKVHWVAPMLHSS